MAVYARQKVWSESEDLYYQDLNEEFDEIALAANAIVADQLATYAVEEDHIAVAAVETASFADGACATEAFEIGSIKNVAYDGESGGYGIAINYTPRPEEAPYPVGWITIATVNIGVNPGDVLLLASLCLWTVGLGGIFASFGGYEARIIADYDGDSIYETVVAEIADMDDDEREYRCGGRTISGLDQQFPSPQVVPIRIVDSPPDNGVDVRYRLQARETNQTILNNDGVWAKEYHLTAIGMKR